MVEGAIFEGRTLITNFSNYYLIWTSDCLFYFPEILKTTEVCENQQANELIGIILDTEPSGYKMIHDENVEVCLITWPPPPFFDLIILLTRVDLWQEQYKVQNFKE